MVTYMNTDTAHQYELWLSALEAAHAEGAHGSDPSRYWRKAGCPSCISAEAADAEAEAFMARIAADAARLRARRLKAYDARQAREPYPLSRKRSA